MDCVADGATILRSSDKIIFTWSEHHVVSVNRELIKAWFIKELLRIVSVSIGTRVMTRELFNRYLIIINDFKRFTFSTWTAFRHVLHFGLLIFHLIIFVVADVDDFHFRYCLFARARLHILIHGGLKGEDRLLRFRELRCMRLLHINAYTDDKRRLAIIIIT